MPWAPFPGGQTEFLSRGEFEVLYGGLAGPGKTDCLVAGMLRDIENGNYRGLIVRRTFPRLEEVIERCWKLYPEMGGDQRDSGKVWKFPSGAVIRLGHVQHEDSKYDYQGKDYHRIGVDELTQFTETQYTYLVSRLRTTDPTLNPQIISTTNPGGEGHQWVKDRFISVVDPGRVFWDPATGTSRIFVQGKREDNPALLLNDPTYEMRLNMLPEIERMRLKDGNWDSFEGQVFGELSQRVHGFEDTDIPPDWERLCILDWGFAKPFVVYWAAMDYDGCLWVYREWYGCKREAEGIKEGADVGLKLQAWEVGKRIAEIERDANEKIRTRLADPSIFDPRPQNRKQETRGLTVHDDLVSQGLFFLKADNNREHGKLQVHKRLKIETEVDPETGEILSEEPMIRIANSCKGFWRTVPTLREDPRNPDDVDTDMEDHPYDGIRYLCMSRPIRPRKYSQVAPGSFMAERNRLIRAKKLARSRGISVGDAFSRLR